MIQFKPGDRVRATQESYGPELVPIGAVGTVVRVPFRGVVSVAFDGDTAGDGTGMWAMFDFQLVHVHPAVWRFARWPVAVMLPRIRRALVRAYTDRAARRKRKADARTAGPFGSLCPAPVRAGEAKQPCLDPLPCARHNVSNMAVGFALHGSSYAYVPAGRA